MPNNHARHVKSHYGCLRCKAHRVKCDEKRPHCTRCTRNGVQCSLAEEPNKRIFVEGPDSRGFLSKRKSGTPSDGLTGLHSLARHSEASPDSDKQYPSSQTRNEAQATNSASGLGPEGCLTASTSMEIHSLRLMHHYSQHAWRACAFNNEHSNFEIQTLWRDIVPELAFAHKFLMHSLLAVTALHYVLGGFCEESHVTLTISIPTKPSLRAMVDLATWHYSLALPLVREALQKPLTDDTRPPLFLNAVLISVYAFASELAQSPNPAAGPLPQKDPIEALVRLIALLHGTAPIIGPIAESITTTPLQAMMLESPKIPDLPLNHDRDMFLRSIYNLHERNLEKGAYPDAVTAEAYWSALQLVRDMFALQQENPSRPSISIPFAVLLPDVVLADMSNGTPLALCMAAAYAIVLHGLRHHIWIQGWGRCIILEVAQRLHESEAEGVVSGCVEEVESTPMPE